MSHIGLMSIVKDNDDPVNTISKSVLISLY